MLSHKLLMGTNETESGYSLSTFNKGWSGEGYYHKATGYPTMRYGEYGWLKSDGLQFWLMAQNTSYPYYYRLYRFNMTTANDLSTMTYSNEYTVDSSVLTSTLPVAWKQDGSKLFIADKSGDEKIYQWPVSPAFDAYHGVGGGLGTSSNYDLTSDTGTNEWGDLTTSGFRDPEGLIFKSDGTKMFVGDRAEEAIYEYSLSTAWDVTTASYNDRLVTTSVDNQLNHFTMKADGTRLYHCDSSDIHEWSLSTAWDVSTATFSQTHSNVRAGGGYLNGLNFSSDGTKLINTNRGYPKNTLEGYTLSTAWDLSTIAWQGPTTGQFKSLASDLNDPLNFTFGKNGTRIYVADQGDEAIHEFHLSTAYDITTATHDYELDVSSQTTVPTAAEFKSDGTKMFVSDYVADEILEYDLSTAWDISTASYSAAYDINNSTNGIYSFLAENLLIAFRFKPDGTAFFISGRQEDRYIFKFTLSTAWDITTAAFSQYEYVRGLANYEQTTDFAFNPAGTQMILTSGYYEKIMECALTTAWDINSAVFVRLIDTPQYMGYLFSGQFNDDGTKFVTFDRARDHLLEFDLE